MSTEPVTAALTAVGTKKVLENLLNNAFALGKDVLGPRWQAWRASIHTESLYKKLRAVRMVKTIWQFEKPIDLMRFYCPSHVRVTGIKRRIRVNGVDDLPGLPHMVIQGTVGQGKSILSRYLAAVEMSRGQCLPVFVEFRKIKDETLLEHILTQTRELGFQLDEDGFRFLADQAKVCLFLDAFDEAAEAKKEQFIVDIESLCKQHENLRIIVTSRPGSGIAASNLLNVVDLCPLEGDEWITVAKKIANNTDTAKAIVIGVTQAPHVRELLTTPLMVGLLAFRYRVDNSIPQNIVDFFDQLLLLLLQRHDKSKAGYQRPRRCGGTDSQIQRGFEALSFVTRKAGNVGSFRLQELSTHAKEALRLAEEGLNPDHFLEDVIRITCLILEEAGDCRYLHKSVQEFHAASFLRYQPDALVGKFYESVLSGDKWRSWEQELRFLAILDRYRFQRHFYLPALAGLLDIEESESGFKCISFEEFCFRVLSPVVLHVDRDKSSAVVGGVYVAASEYYHLRDHPHRMADAIFALRSQKGAIRRIAVAHGTPHEHNRLKLPAVTLLESGEEMLPLMRELRAMYDEMISDYRRVDATCRQTEGNRGAFDV